MAVSDPQTKVNFDAGTDDPKLAFSEQATNVDIYNAMVALLGAMAEAAAGDGLIISGGNAAVDLATDPGLEISTAKLRAKIAATNPGLVRNAAGLAALVAAARGIKITSSGLEIDIPGLTEDTSPDLAADFIPIYDTSGTVIKKVKPENLSTPGGLVKLNTQNIGSSVAQVDITSNIDSTYDLYMLLIEGLSTTVNPSMRLRISIASAFKSGASDYNYHLAGTGFGGPGQTDQTYIGIGENATHPASDTFADYMIWFTRPNAGKSSFWWTMRGGAGSGSDYGQGAGSVTIAGAIDGIRIFPSSGNIDDGNFTLYGVVK